MRCLFIITEHMNTQQLDHSYLLCIAMLNFDHEVNVLFQGQAFAQIDASAETKKWLALKLYGVKHLYQLQSNDDNRPATGQTAIDMTAFSALKKQMDWIS